MKIYNNLLSKLYYDPENEASFSTAEKLFKKAKLQNGSIRLSDVKSWLSGQLTYTLHKPIRKNYKRCKVIVSKPNEQWQADLVDLQKFDKQNNGFKYLLTVIDVFTRFAYVQPLKSKTSSSIISAFEKIFNHSCPTKLQTDRGKEFVNKEFKKFLKSYDVHLFHSNNIEIKCSLVERFNRTLKSKMFKYFTSKGTNKYIDVLDKLTRSYNNSKHRITKMRPNRIDFKNKDKVFKNIYGYNTLRDLLYSRYQIPKFKIGDKVRIKYIMNKFDRGYYPNWSDQIYTIFKIRKKIDKNLYFIKDAHGNLIEKRFYNEELQKVKENLYRVEKIIKRRHKNGKSELFVKWLNYPKTFNSWIDAEDLVEL